MGHDSSGSHQLRGIRDSSENRHEKFTLLGAECLVVSIEKQGRSLLGGKINYTRAAEGVAVALQAGGHGKDEGRPDSCLPLVDDIGVV